MAPPSLENGLHTSLNGSTVAENSMDSISDSIVNIGDAEIKECVLEDLGLLKDKLEAQGMDLNELLGQEISDLIKIWKNIEHLKDTELDNASDLADLIAGKIAGFDREQLLEMLDFSKISYGDKDGKLTRDEYKTKRQLAKEGYQIIQFFEDERTENQYCPDEDYKLEQRNYGYDLICSNSWNRDAGYVFIKGREVTIAYHGTRDGSDFKTDLYAYLTELPFLPEGNSVHSGFYSLFKRSWPSVYKILQGHANDEKLKIENLKINVTGHSMGGALASIAALCLNETENAKNVHVATFGSPRVFYKDAAKVYSECLGNKTIRVACRSDNIPCLPPGGGHEYYKHVGQALKLGVNETTFIPDVTLHYHRLNTYRSLIKGIKQESFKSDNVSSWWRYIAYPIGKLLSTIPVEVSEDSDKEFFKKVQKENEDVKLSEVPIQYAPNLEEKFRQREQKVIQLTNDKIQLEKRLKSIKQSLDEKTEELKSTQAQLEQERKGTSEKLTQEQQKTRELNDQVTELTNDKAQLEGRLSSIQQSLDEKTKELKGKKAQLAEKEAELDEQTREVTELNDTIRELKETNIKLEKNVGNLNNQFAKEKKALEDLKVQSEQNKVELEKKKEELNDTKRKLDSQASRIVEFTAEIEELRKIKTGLEGKAEFAEKALKDAQIELKESVGELDVAKENISQLEKKLKQAQQNLAKETNEIIQLNRESNKTNAQFEEKKNKIRELNGQVAQLAAEKTQLERQLNDARQDCINQIGEINQLKNIADKSNNNKKLSDKNKNFLEASKKQCIYAAVSFISSGAFAVGASLTMFHLAICVSLIIAASTFLAVGCYCSYKTNTALSDVKVGQIGNDARHSAA